MASRRQRHAVPLDTSIAARERQVAAWVAMGPERRARLAASMTDDVRRVAAQGLVTRTSPSGTAAKRSR